jgi:hypothetical protein
MQKLLQGILIFVQVFARKTSWKAEKWKSVLRGLPETKEGEGVMMGILLNQGLYVSGVKVYLDV